VRNKLIRDLMARRSYNVIEDDAVYKDPTHWVRPENSPQVFISHHWNILTLS